MDAHYSEYLAAADGMTEIYGTNNPGRAVVMDGELHTCWDRGDSVRFRHAEHGELAGVIVKVLIDAGNSSTYHVAAHVPGRGRQHFAVMNRDVLIF